MAFDFPSAPADGDIANGPNGILWKWDGVKWIAISAEDYLPLSGGTMTGGISFGSAINSPPSSVARHLTLYAPAGYGIGVSSGRQNYVAGGGGTHAFMVSTADIMTVATAGATMASGKTLTLAADPALALEAATKQYVDNRDALYVPLAGGTMTGILTLSGAPSQPLHAATKAYADLKLALTGGTLSGALTLVADPAVALGAATKQYVDAVRTLVTGSYLPLSGGTMTGSLFLAGDPASPTGAATKQYVDALRSFAAATYLPLAGGTMTGGISFGAVLDTGSASTARHLTLHTSGYGIGITSGRMNYVVTGGSHVFYVSGDIVTIAAAGMTMAATKTLTLAQDPTLALHAATKQYVDGISGEYLPLAGGTLTGPLWLAADPIVDPLQATTKEFVDETVADNALWQGTYVIATNTPDIASLAREAYSWTAITQDPNVAEALTVALPPIPIGTIIHNSDLLMWSTAEGWSQIMGASLTKQEADQWYVFRAGDTMFGGLSFESSYAANADDVSRHIAIYGTTYGFGVTANRLNYVAGLGGAHVLRVEHVDVLTVDGANATSVVPLTLPGDAVSNLQAVPLQQVNSLLAGYLPLTGGTVTGTTTFSAALPLRFGGVNAGAMPATYFGGALTMNFSNGGGEVDFWNLYPSAATSFNWYQATGTGTNTLLMTLSAAGALTLTTGDLVANAGVSFGSAVAPGGNADLSRHISLYSTTFGFSITSSRLNYVVPATNSHRFLTGTTDVVSISSAGLAMVSGAITLLADPTSALQAATKQYVDGHPGEAPNDGGTYGRAALAWVRALPMTPVGAGSLDLNTYMNTEPASYRITNQAGGVNFPPGQGASPSGFLIHGFGSNSGWVDQLFLGPGNVGIDNLWFRNSNGANWNRWCRIITDNGGTLQGALVLAADPTTALGAATRQYVDAVTTALGNYLPLSGGVLSGLLTLAAGAQFGSTIASNPDDFSHHIALWGNNYGFSVTGGRLNYNIAGTFGNHVFIISDVDVLNIGSSEVLSAVPLTLPGEPTASWQAVPKYYSDRNKSRGLIAVTSNAATPTVSDVDYAYLYVYGSPTAPSTITMPVATTTRLLWTINNTTAFPTTIEGVSGQGYVTIPSGGSQAVWTDTAGIYPLYNTGSTRPANDSSTFLATTEFVTGAVGHYLPLTGGSLTGPLTMAAAAALTLSADPTTALQAATKQYVDDHGGGAAVASYGFNTAITAPPANNQIRLNTTDQTLATVLWIDDQAGDGTDISMLMSLVGAGEVIYLQDQANAAQHQAYTVTGAASDMTGYWAVPISWHGGGSALTNTNKAKVSLLFGTGSYLPISGGTLTGPLTISTATAPPFKIDGAAATWRTQAFSTGDLNRFSFGLDNSAESGSSAGSNFVLSCFNDAGAPIYTPLIITRATGAFTFSADANFNAGIGFGNAVATDPTDVSRHIALFSTLYGFNVTGSRLNYYVAANAAHWFNVAGADILNIAAAGLTMAAGKTLTLAADPTTALQAATKQYVDARVWPGDAPSDGNSYGRLNAAWAGVLPLTGGTLTGQLTVNANVTADSLFAGMPQGISDFYLSVDPIPGSRILNWSATWFDMWRSSDGLRAWWGNGVLLMTLDGNGNLTANGKVTGGGGVLFNSSGTYAAWTDASGNQILQYATGHYDEWEVATGNRRFIGGGSQQLMVLDNGGNLDVIGHVTAGGIAAISAGGMGAVSVNSNSGTFYVYSNPNYYMGRGSDGWWRWVENGVQTVGFDPSGNIQAQGNITGNNITANSAMIVTSAAGISYAGLGGNYVGLQFSGSALVCYNGGTEVGYTLLTASDGRLKDNVAPAGDALADLARFNVVAFDLLDAAGEFDKHYDYGLLADEVLDYAPDVVHVPQRRFVDPEVEPFKTIEPLPMIGRLVKAVQQLEAITAAQAARIAQLEARTLH